MTDSKVFITIYDGIQYVKLDLHIRIFNISTRNLSTDHGDYFCLLYGKNRLHVSAFRMAKITLGGLYSDC